MESEVSKAQAAKSQRERPTGVSLVAIWLSLEVFTIIISVRALVAGNQSFGSGVNNLINLFIGIASLPLAWGLWKLKPWAVRETIGLLSIAILCRVGEFLIFQEWHSSYLVVSIIVFVLFNVWIIRYLATSQNVREAFIR